MFARLHLLITLAAVAIAAAAVLPVADANAEVPSADADARAHAWCVPPNIHASVSTATSFGANLGDTVYWRVIARELKNGRYSWNTSSSWDRYQVVDDNGGYWDPVRRVFTFTHKQERSSYVRINYPALAAPAIQYWTPQHGYDWYYITYSDEDHSSWCHFPYLSSDL